MKSFLLAAILFSPLSYAFNSVLETGDLLKEGEYAGTVYSEFLLDDESGINFSGRFDTWLNEELNSQIYFGAGQIDFFVGGLAKWVPFPDFDQQPAIGFKAGPEYAREGGSNFLNLKLIPFASKKFDTDIGFLTPFGSLPIAIRSVDGKTILPVHLAGGVEWEFPQMEKIKLLTELGVDINKSSTYWTLALQVGMDDTNGFQLR